MSERFNPEINNEHLSANEEDIKEGSLINYDGELYKVHKIIGDTASIYEVGTLPDNLTVVETDTLIPITESKK